MGQKAYTITIEYTDRTIIDGKFRSFFLNPTILADNETEAHLIALQLIGALIEDHDGMVISSRLLPCSCTSSSCHVCI